MDLDQDDEEALGITHLQLKVLHRIGRTYKGTTDLKGNAVGFGSNAPSSGAGGPTFMRQISNQENPLSPSAGGMGSVDEGVEMANAPPLNPALSTALSTERAGTMGEL